MMDYTNLLRMLKTYEDGYGLYLDAAAAIEALEAKVADYEDTLKWHQKEIAELCAMIDDANARLEVGKAGNKFTLNATEQPHWVSVEEPPKDQRPVLVFVPPHEEYDDYCYGYVGMAYYTYSANGGFWCGTDGNVYGAVGMIHIPTHWMPLPEPPKEVTNE